MDAAMEGILAGGEPVPLLTSYKSRPALVRLTSSIFVPAFAQHGIPEERVRLRPASQAEPPGLGPILEHWALSTKNKDDDAAALASATRQFLSASVVVWDRATGTPRALQPGDVTALCHTNVTFFSVANALGEQGVRACLERTGLFATLEAWEGGGRPSAVGGRKGRACRRGVGPPDRIRREAPRLARAGVRAPLATIVWTLLTEDKEYDSAMMTDQALIRLASELTQKTIREIRVGGKGLTNSEGFAVGLPT